MCVSPSVLLLNARSITNKLDEFRVLISNFSPDCVAVTETWLSESLPNDLLTITNYTLFRSDRLGRIGGGVCIYVHDSCKPELPNQLRLSGSESVIIHLPQSNVLLLCLYIPPNLTSAQHNEISDNMTQYLDTFLQEKPNIKPIICGDFNDYHTDLFLTHFNCVNRVKNPTRGNSFLDQIWISESLEDNYPDSAIVGPPLANSDHCSVLLRPSMEARASKIIEKTVFDYRASNIQRFLHALESSNFYEVYSADDVDAKCNAFCSLFLKALSEIPKKKIIITERDKPWITPVLKKMIQDRWDAYRTKNWPVFLHLKTKVRTEIQHAKKSWCDRILEKEKNIWNVVRDLQGKKRQHCPLDDVEDLRRLVREITECFLSNFNSVSDTQPCELMDEVWDVKVTPFLVFNMLTHLRLNQSPGNDAIPSLLLRKSAEIICKPLSDIFRASIRSRKFPSYWKEGLIRPIPKVKNPSADEFRPITLLPILSKVLEKIVLNSMKAAFVQNFGEHQHAFRPYGSSTSALIQIHDSITSFLESEDSLGVRLTCFDFQKAFDKVQHGRLVNSLKAKGLNQGFLLWLRSFLSDRHSSVTMNRVLGPSFLVLSGVPQGSVLGPYLFAMFVSTINIDNIYAKIIKFADDLTLVECLSRRGEPSNGLQTILAWSKENNMPLNPKKCQQMIIKKAKGTSLDSYKYADLQLVRKIRILGVIFSNDLKWNIHFEQVTLSASRRLHILRCLRRFVSKEMLFTVFRASVLAVVLYASPLFGSLPYKAKCSVNKIVKRAHRIICGPLCEPTCDYVPDVTKLRDKAACNLLLKCEIPDHPLHCLVPPKMPRTNHFRLPHCSTLRRMNSFFPSTCLLVNSYSNFNGTL